MSRTFYCLSILTKSNSDSCTRLNKSVPHSDGGAGRAQRFCVHFTRSVPRDENHRREKYISTKSAFATRILGLKQRQRKPQKTLIVDAPMTWRARRLCKQFKRWHNRLRRLFLLPQPMDKIHRIPVIPQNAAARKRQIVPFRELFQFAPNRFQSGVGTTAPWALPDRADKS
jgi:hypothetical protein